MRTKLKVVAALFIAAMLAIPFAASAQTCNLQSPACPGTGPCGFTCTPALGGCGAATPIAHSSVTECTSGSFDLRGTQYENTCATGGGCTQLAAPLRFFQYDNYDNVNHGCGWPGPAGGEWLINTGLDFGFGTPGHYHLFQSNWQGCSLGGCPAGSRTVAEISDVMAADEGTINHNGWYLIAAVDFASGSYDFDRIMGGAAAGGCGEGSPTWSAVSGVTVAGRADPCTGSTVPSSGTANGDPAYGDIDITVDLPDADYYTEAGYQDPGVPLVAGYQIVYIEGAAEPTSSDPALWSATHDTAAPAASRADFIPIGTTGSVTVTVPQPAAGNNIWLAAKLVYLDSTVNAAGTFTFPGGPAVTSVVGPHCGPVIFGTTPTAVNFDYVTATHTPAGVLVRWMTTLEDDVRGFSVFRTLSNDSTEAGVEVSDVVKALGSGAEYEFVDASAASSDTYFYYILERTSFGPGMKSRRVEAVSLNDGGVSEGTRKRKGQIR